MLWGMNRICWLGVACLVMFLGTSCKSTDSEHVRFATINGTVASRPPMVVPANAVVEVQLLAVEGGGSPKRGVASATLSNPGEMPIKFRLSYPVGAYRVGTQHAVEARILVDGRPWMVTETVNHFMAEGRIVGAEVIVRPLR